MSKPLYDALGLDPSASEKDVRTAFRKLAKQYHPDLNPADKQAEDKFKEISAALEILGDKEKRKKYDAGEIDETGAEKPHYQTYRQYADTDADHHYHSSQSFEDFADLGDIFSDLFRQQEHRTGARRGSMDMRGPDRRYHLKVTFLEAATGAKKRIAMPGRSLDINIPRGIDSGQTIRLKGKGEPGIGKGPPGDALIEVEVAPHRLFSRDGLDVIVELPITVYEAVLGGKVEVPTISGAVNMTIPKGANTGQTLRLKGRGIKSRSGKAGDQLVRLKIVLPDKVDRELESAMQAWKEEHAYDPRSKMKVSA